MNKLTKISAAALFTLFLSACDKPADQSSAANAQTETANAQTEAAKPSEAAAETAVDTGAEDYKKFQEWQQTQEKSINDAINAAVEKLGDKAKDPEAMQEAVNKAVLAQIEHIKQSAATLGLQDEKVNMLKDKSLEAISLGAQMITENEKVVKNPTPEAHQAFGELQKKLESVAQEGQQIEAELAAKYGPAQAPAAPVQEPAAPAQHDTPAQEPAAPAQPAVPAQEPATPAQK